MRRILLLVFALAACAIALAYIYGVPFGSYAIALVTWFQRKGSVGVVLYGALDVLATVLLFPGTLFTLGAGFLYGTVLGSAVVSIASTTAATIAFLLARYVAGDWLSRRSHKYTLLHSLDQNIADHGFKMVLLMRLQPVFIPFAYLNMGLGLSRVRLWDFVAGSWLGMLPGTILYVYTGSLLNMAYFAHFSVRSLFVQQSSRMHALSLLIGAAAFLAFCVLIGRIARGSLRSLQLAGCDAEVSRERAQSSQHGRDNV